MTSQTPQGTPSTPQSVPVSRDCSSPAERKNILLILVDQLRFPRFSYGPNYGFAQPIKLLTGFQEPADPSELDPTWAKTYFPGLWSLREHAVVLRRHYIGASACMPSRTVMMTGQYGTRTGVTQTDGLFKNGDSPLFPWLSPEGIPTIGSWMREAGYKTHYFGKWHVSNPPEHNLRRFGFDDWELSYPEPHGSLLNNLGLYRDYQFADLAVAFLRRHGLGGTFARFDAEKNYDDPMAMIALRAAQAGLLPGQQDDSGQNPSIASAVQSGSLPWFAVVSFANPHDIATYPGLPRNAVSRDNFASNEDFLAFLRAPLGVPDQAWRSSKPAHGTAQFDLNPLGFPQDGGAANLPPTLFEDLASKPRCQYDYAYKMGLALASKLGWQVALNSAGVTSGTEDLSALWARAAQAMRLSGLPFQLQDDPVAWSLAFIRYYAYLAHVVDQHIARVLQALRESGQEENTIVLFMADHGEYAAAHGMLIEKWHAAYEEGIHVPFLVRSPSINADPTMKQCDALTSHVDLLPTILGLAGVDAQRREHIQQQLRVRSVVPELVGCDLSPLIRAVGSRPTVEPTEEEVVVGADGKPRAGILFITDDEITAPLPNTKGDPHSFKSHNEYESYLIAAQQLAEQQRAQGTRPIADGPVRQPNHVRCVLSQYYKLSRYWDPSGKEADEWEMYDLRHDPNETVNLLAFDQPFPTVAKDVPAWAGTAAEIEAQARDLRVILADLEARML